MDAMSKRQADPPPESPAPYGTDKPRPRWVLGLLIVLCAAWLAFLVRLVLLHRS